MKTIAYFRDDRGEFDSPEAATRWLDQRCDDAVHALASGEAYIWTPADNAGSLEALKRLTEEAKDWETVLEGERPSLTLALAFARDVIAAEQGEQQ